MTKRVSTPQSAQENREIAVEKSKLVVAKLHAMKLSKSAKIFEEGVSETLTYMKYPREHWKSIRTNNPMERIMKEIRRRTNVAGSFPDGYSSLMLVCSRLRYITTHSWGVSRHISINLFSQ
jgi:putative transposase